MAASLINDLVSKKDAIESWITTLEVWMWIFGILVAIGVAGESLITISSLRNNKALRLAQKEIDAERDRMESEKEREHDRQSELLKLEIATANERAAEANAKAERERIERMKLEAQVARISPRSLTKEQRVVLKLALEEFKDQKFLIITRPDNPEGDEFGRVLTECLKDDCGWTAEAESPNVSKHAILGVGVAFVSGIFSGDAARDEQARDRIKKTIAAFKSAGIDVFEMRSGFLPVKPGVIGLLIGKQPLPTAPESQPAP